MLEVNTLQKFYFQFGLPITIIKVLLYMIGVYYVPWMIISKLSHLFVICKMQVTATAALSSAFPQNAIFFVGLEVSHSGQ